MNFLLIALASIFMVLYSNAASTACRDNALALQVLGSGGPVADDERSASGYLLWHKGRSLVLIDAGGGVFQRFGAAGGSLDDLELIALTHFHTDHAADFPAILKGAYFSDRSRPLPVSGPDGEGAFPALEIFLERMFGENSGAFAYLSELLESGEDFPLLEPITVDHGSRTPQAVLEKDSFSVEAVGVHHGPVPSLGYLIRIDGRKIAISGDQNLSTDFFTEMIRGADLLVMPMAVPQYDQAVSLHARPSEIGQAAGQAQVGKLVLSHWMSRSLRQQDRNVRIVQENYDGPVQAAADLMCISLPEN